MRLTLLSCGWLAGIYLSAGFHLYRYAILPAFLLPLLPVLLWRRKAVYLWSGLCLLCLLGGFFRFQFAASEPTLPLYNNHGRVEIEGIVERDPDPEDGFTKLRLSARRISTGGRWEDASGSVLIYTSSFPSYSYGDTLKATGELQEPPQLEGFDYKAFLARQGIYSIMSSPSIELIGKGWIPGIREHLAQSLAAALHEPHSSLAQALVLGIRSSLPDDLMDAFRRTGTAHIIAISGLHVAILGGMVLTASAWLLGRQHPTYIFLTLGAVWLYALLAGMSSSVFRAAIMFSLYLLALWAGRPRSVMPALALAAAVMTGLNPKALWDISFQLSFAAVAGVIFIALPLLPPLHDRLDSMMRERSSMPAFVFAIGHSLTISMGAIVATLPLIVYYFHYVSLVGLPATLVILLALPAIIATTLLSALLGLFIPLLSEIIGWVAWLFLGYIIVIAEGFASIPFASYQLGPINGIWVLLYYLILVAALWLLPQRKQIPMWLARISKRLRVKIV